MSEEENQSCNIFKRLFHHKQAENVRETIEDLIEEAAENGKSDFSQHEQLLLNNVLDLRDRHIENAMIPRADIIAFPKSGSVEDGGKVEIHKVEEKGILIGDKANASYEGEEETDDSETASSEEVNEDVTRRLSQLPQSDDEQITPAKVTDITKSDDLPKTKHSDSAFEATDNDSAVSSPSMRYLAGIIYFTNGGSYLDSNARTTLRQIANQAKKRHAQVEVYGFASSRTRNTDPVSHKLANFKISADRANNVASALRSLGVEKDQIAVQALSDSMPMYQEVMPEGERLNRRAEIYLTY